MQSEAVIDIRVAEVHDLGTVLSLVDELLAELGDEGREFSGVDRERLRADLERVTAEPEAGEATPDEGPLPGSGRPGWGRFVALLAEDSRGGPIGLLTLSTGFALYAGGEYGVIDEMYVRPGYRSQGVGRRLVEAAVAIARRRRWFRLDVTGPVGVGPVRGGPVGAEPMGAAGGESVHCGPAGDPRGASRALRFYEGLGFEFTGPKLRLLVGAAEPGSAQRTQQ